MLKRLTTILRASHRRMPIREYSLSKALECLKLNFIEVRTFSLWSSSCFTLLPKFMDLCILMGCDYCDTIRGIGQKRAFNLIQQHRNIETILKHIDRTVQTVISQCSLCQSRCMRRSTECLTNGRTNKQESYSKNLKCYQRTQLTFVFSWFFYHSLSGSFISD
jgi:5'-3' exonuclease